MVMAGSSTQVNQSSPELSKADKLAVKVGVLISLGVSRNDLAKQLGKGDPVRQKAWRQKIRLLLATNPLTQAQLGMAAQADLWESLGPATQAIIARAKRGRPDAVRMVWAATGFHNEKVQHDHSGEVQVTLAINRPARVEDRTKRMDLEEGIVDAEVVEEDDPGT